MSHPVIQFLFQCSAVIFSVYPWRMGERSPNLPPGATEVAQKSHRMSNPLMGS